MNKMHSEMISTATSTSSSETRKSSKPIMEKRRRARMNASLTELKSLLLEVMKKEGNRHSKMEKADILEMTVKHLRQLQRQHFTVPTIKEESPFLTKYTLGFQECTSEVSRYLSSVAEVDADVRVRLLDHLATHISQPSTPSAVSSSSPTSTTANTTITAPVSRPSSVTDTSPHQSPVSITSPPSPPTTSTPQLVAPPQPTAPPPPAQIQLQLTPSLAQSVSSVQSSQISVSTTQTTTRPESMVAPKRITIFPADFCTATTTTTTATATPFTAPATGGILSLDASCPQIQTAKLLSGVQLITTRLPNGQMAFVLPTNLMTETQQTQQIQQTQQQQTQLQQTQLQQTQLQQTQQQQTIQQQTQPQTQQQTQQKIQPQTQQPTQQLQLIQQQPRQQPQQSYIPIPVYAPSSPAIPPMTTTVGGAPGVMALLPQVSKAGVTPTASMAFIPHIFPFPQMAGLNPSISHLPLVRAETSEATTSLLELRSDATTTGATVAGTSFTSVTEINRPIPLPELPQELASAPVAQPQTPAKRVENIVVEPAPVLQQVEEENVWRPWAH